MGENLAISQHCIGAGWQFTVDRVVTDYNHLWFVVSQIAVLIWRDVVLPYIYKHSFHGHLL
jgi:hypothetical protein